MCRAIRRHYQHTRNNAGPLQRLFSVRKDSERLMWRAHDFFRFEMFSTFRIKQSIQQQFYAKLYIH